MIWYAVEKEPLRFKQIARDNAMTKEDSFL